jgi:fluoride ion exporter CrcB/FEX
MAFVTQCTSIYFYTDPESQVIALSLLFSPLGVIARWRLARYNVWRPTFPVGTFFCNILACALSGGLGTLLAGNPGERERLVLVSFINGFGGTLSSVAAFIVEVLAGIDPVLLRFDGLVYALLSVFWAMVVGFLFTASADWADETG